MINRVFGFMKEVSPTFVSILIFILFMILGHSFWHGFWSGFFLIAALLFITMMFHQWFSHEALHIIDYQEHYIQRLKLVVRKLWRMYRK